MRVFVSYSRDDAPYARELSEALRERGIDVSGDMSIMAGARWATELRRMMDDADAFVLLTSKSSAASGSVDREVAAATARASRDRNVRLIPVILDRRAEIPPLLSRYQFVGPPIARDPDRVADLIRESLSSAVSPPDIGREREVVEAERANLDRVIAQRDLAVAKSWRALARVLSVVGLAAGITATTLVAVWVNAGPQVASVVIAVISVFSTSLATAMSFYFRRSRSGD
jgi:hypothetical protein